jgi:serine/threonine-protein kinase
VSSALDRAIGLLTDGQSPDWDALLDEAADAEERSRITDLRSLARLTSGDGIPSAHPMLTIGAPADRTVIAPRRWGHFELLAEIGHGAHGVVYHALDTRLARDCAVKLLRDDTPASIEEARRLARVSHPNVVAVYGVERFDGQVGVWMELLRGRSLDAMIREHGAFSEREATAMAIDICAAVAAVHRAGLIHRDIKAQNVMREQGGRLVVMDLGASIPTAESEAEVSALAGTPLYFAPELFQNARASKASDVYALGVLMYRMVTGAFPIEAQTVGDVRRAHAASSLKPMREVRSGLRHAFVSVVERCLAREPSRRFQSAEALERALLDLLERRSETKRRVTLVAAAAVTMVAGSLWVALRVPATLPASSATVAVAPELQRVFDGFETLAFLSLEENPKAAVEHLRAGLSQMRASLPGQHPLFALIYARLSEASRLAGDLDAARAYQLDGEAHVLGSVGPDHPVAAVVGMERAQNAGVAGNIADAELQAATAHVVRRRVLGLSDDLPVSAVPVFSANPFLTWIQFGAMQPGRLGWQAAPQFPVVSESTTHGGLPALSVTAPQSMAYYTHRLSPAKSSRALERGFSVHARALPLSGFISLVVDLAPVGPRFDLLLRRVDASVVQAGLASSVAPRRMQTVDIGITAAASWPVFELRYLPESRSVTLLVDGQVRLERYQGHRQFQSADEGAVTWGVAPIGDGDDRASGLFHLFWAEIR